MDLIKWKCKNWIVYFKQFDNFHLIHLIIEKLDVFNFHPIFYYCYFTNFTVTWENWTRFLKNIHQKLKYYWEEKQDFERFLICLNIKMSAKSNKIKPSEEFMVMWKEESHQRCSLKEVLLTISRNSQGNTNTCARVFF